MWYTAGLYDDTQICPSIPGSYSGEFPSGDFVISVMGQRANFIYPWGKKRLDHLAYDEGMVHMNAFPVLQWQYIPTFFVFFLLNFNSIVHPTPNPHSQPPPPPVESHSPPPRRRARSAPGLYEVAVMVTCGRGARFASWFASFLYNFQSRFVLYKYNAQLGTHLHPHMLEYMCVKATPPPTHTHTHILFPVAFPDTGG